MAKCKHCGRKSLFLKLTDGLCENCLSTALMQKEQAEIQEKALHELEGLRKQADYLKEEIADADALYQKISSAAKAEALKEAEAEQEALLERRHKLSQELAQMQEKLQAVQDAQAKAQKDAGSLVRKVQKGRELVKAIQHYEDEFEAGIRPAKGNALLEDLDSYLRPTVELNPNCLDMRELRKRYRQNEKAIQGCLEKYKSRYTTKANITIYRLMCMALNAELQNILTTLRYGKLEDGLAKVTKMTDVYLQIAADGSQSIAPTVKKFIGEIDYYYQEAVKIEYEYYVKKERAREEQQAIREQMRQEAEERRELERQRKQVEKEESKFSGQIQQLMEQMQAASDDRAALLQARIEELEQQKAALAEQKEKIASLQNGKAGNVYVISNLGSFGEDVFKIGMTRRLDPLDRVAELGSASVPFPFDVHSMIFSNDAVSLETELHHILTDNRVNKVNLRKEFFRISLDDLEALVNHIAPTAEFKRTMVAEQYRQSLSIGHVVEVDESEAEDNGSDDHDE